MNSTRPPRDPAFLAALLAITAAGAVLRFWNLGIQILGDDEQHIIMVVVSTALGDIRGTVGQYDFGIPLAMLFRAWSDVTPLTECVLRGPMLLFGMLTPALAGCFARRYAGRGVALAVALAVAAHPMFVFYSRFVRTYAICIVLLVGAWMLLDRWMTSRASERRSVLPLAGVAVLCALACWFQPLAGLSVALLFLGALAAELLARARRQDGRPLALVVCGAGALGLTLLLFGPAVRGVYEQFVKGKVGAESITAEPLLRNAAVVTGMPGVLPWVVFFALIVGGAVLLARRVGLRALPLLVPALANPVLIVLMRPVGFPDAQVLARYQFYVLPIWLLLATLALAALGRWLLRVLAPRVSDARAAAAGLVASVLLAAAWVLLGPYATIYTEDNAFAHHWDFQTFRHLADPRWHAARAHAPDAPVHPAYLQLEGAGDEAPPVIEWPPPFDFPRNFLHYAQAVHRRPMKLLVRTSEIWWTGPQLALGGVVVVGPDRPLALAPGAVIVLHKHPVLEAAWFVAGVAGWLPPVPAHEKAYEEVRALVEAQYGPPAVDDRFLAMFVVPP